MACSIIDGHDHSTVRSAIQKAQVIDRPSIIIGNTIMAKGTASMEGSPGTHGSPLPHDEIASTKKGLGLPEETFFHRKKCKTIFSTGSPT
jgi:transketolase